MGGLVVSSFALVTHEMDPRRIWMVAPRDDIQQHVLQTPHPVILDAAFGYQPFHAALPLGPESIVEPRHGHGTVGVA